MIVVGRQSVVYECCRAWEKYQRDIVLVTGGFHFPPLKNFGGGGGSCDQIIGRESQASESRDQSRL